MEGDFVAEPTERMEWYKGEAVLELLDSFEESKSLEEKPFRMPVQAVYKFTGGGDTRRIVSGTIDSGKVQVGIN